MHNRYGEVAWSPGLVAGVGPRQDSALGLGQALRWHFWRGNDPPALSLSVFLWWLSHAHLTVRNHTLGLPAQASPSPPPWEETSWELV